MALRQLNPRDPCHCGSGKRYKYCHRKADRIAPVLIQSDDGFTATLHVSNVSASRVEETDSQVPEWLFRHAAQFAEEASSADTHAATMMTLLLTAAASEALVNRLLGPLIPAQEWKAIELRAPLDKWEELAKRVGVSHKITRGKRPLQDLGTVHRLRNELSHFKHERHAVTVTRPIATSIERGRIVLDAGTAGPPDEKRGAGPDLADALAGTRARSYFGSLVETLEVLLGAYPEDRFSIVQRLREQMAAVRSAGTDSRES
jgi:hypothetical protein